MEKLKTIKYKSIKRTKEEQTQYIQYKQWDKEEKERLKEEKINQRRQKEHNKIELAILNFMLKTDVLYYHHGKSDSMKSIIKQQIESIKNTNYHLERNSYIWNYLGEGNNYMSKCLLGNIFISDEFDTIYEVPLDGSYIFSCFDSGQRGLGSFDMITVKKVEIKFEAPYVNSGAFPQITYNK